MLPKIFRCHEPNLQPPRISTNIYIYIKSEINDSSPPLFPRKRSTESQGQGNTVNPLDSHRSSYQNCTDFDPLSRLSLLCTIVYLCLMKSNDEIRETSFPREDLPLAEESGFHDVLVASRAARRKRRDAIYRRIRLVVGQKSGSLAFRGTWTEAAGSHQTVRTSTL